MTAGIEFTAGGVQITGHPTLEQWGEAFTHALDLGVVATWGRTDLITFAEDETPYEDEHFQVIIRARISEGTYNNDLRRGRRFPRGHALRRYIHICSASHFDAVAPLEDADAEIVLSMAAKEDLGREWVRSEVKRIKQTPDPLTVALTLRVDADGNVEPTVPLPTWTHNHTFEVVLKGKAA